MNQNELTVGGIISNAFAVGMKNVGSLVGAVLLWLITIWIPYLNVGTTIGMIGIVIAMSKGNVISPTEIFDSKYRRYMGEFFLLRSFISVGVGAGCVFLVIPGIVISIAWGQAIYLLLDKGMSPTECLIASNKITYGKKWTIFGGTVLLTLMLYICVAILFFVFGQISAILGAIISILAVIVLVSIMLGASAYIYGVLSKTLDSEAHATPE